MYGTSEARSFVSNTLLNIECGIIGSLLGLMKNPLRVVLSCFLIIVLLKENNEHIFGTGIYLQTLYDDTPGELKTLRYFSKHFLS